MNILRFQLSVSNWSLTFSVIIIQREENKENQWSFRPIPRFFIWNSKYKHTIKNFFHSYLLILKHTWKCKRKCILHQFWNTLAMSILEMLDQRLKVLLSIFCGTKISLEWITTSPFLDLPPSLPLVAPYPPINIEIFSTPHCKF